jgi:phage shock protein PspC (stress-responsive transcriptional regulator)
MTSTTPPLADSPAPPLPTRKLRRSRTNRVGAGVAGGLGEYFGFDPVLFRVLFATAAFFGGAGVVAYVLAWAAIPEEGTERAPVDEWIAWLRRRRVPLWIVGIAAGLLLWLVAFSWWAPHFFLPLIAVVVLLVIAFGRGAPRQPQQPEPQPSAPPAAGPVDFTKSEFAVPSPDAPTWRADTSAWVSEARAARIKRRRRAAPVRIAVLVALVVTLAALATADALRGIVLPAYFWVTLGIVGVGLLVGIALRRTPWSLAVLLLPAVAGLIAFGGSGASLHDGVGQRTWEPVAAPASSYRLAFGQGVLNLSQLQPQSGPRTIHVTMAGGQVRIVAPRSMAVTVSAHIRFGVLSTAAAPTPWQRTMVANGAGVNRTIVPPAAATGQPIRVVVDLADGEVEVVRR